MLPVNVLLLHIILWRNVAAALMCNVHSILLLDLFKILLILTSLSTNELFNLQQCIIFCKIIHLVIIHSILQVKGKRITRIKR